MVRQTGTLSRRVSRKHSQTRAHQDLRSGITIGKRPFFGTLTFNQGVRSSSLRWVTRNAEMPVTIVLQAFFRFPEQYDTDASRQTFKATAKEATAYAGSNIKSFADSASQLQSLMQSIRIKWAGVREILQETGTFRIVIRNQSDDPIYGMGMSFSLDGEVVGSRGQVNANHTVLQKNGETSFEFLPADFPAGLPAIKLSGFSFDLTVQASGQNRNSCQNRNTEASEIWVDVLLYAHRHSGGWLCPERGVDVSTLEVNLLMNAKYVNLDAGKPPIRRNPSQLWRQCREGFHYACRMNRMSISFKISPSTPIC